MQSDIAGLKAGQAKLEAGQETINKQLEKLAVSQDTLSETMDSLEAKTMRLEASQILVNQKLDLLIIEDAKILQCVYKIQDENRVQLNRINAEVQGLVSVTKDNTFDIAKLKHKVS